MVVWDDCVPYLDGCLKNLREQTDCDLRRVVVVDNASLTPIPALDRSIEVIRTPRRVTLGAARNVGLRTVDTPLVCFVDADDLLLPGTLAFLSERMRRRPKLVSCSCALIRWYDVTDTKVKHDWPDAWSFVLCRLRWLFLLRNLFIHQFPVSHATLHRTRVCEDAGGLSEIEYGEDWGLMNSLLARGPVELHRRAGRVYRARARSLGFPTDQAIFASACRVIRERAAEDDQIPALVRALLPVVARYHRRRIHKVLRKNRAELAKIAADASAAP